MNTITEIQNATRKGASTLHNDCISRFKMIRAENWENAIVGTLDRNSFSSKFDELKLMVIGLFDILTITEQPRQLNYLLQLPLFHPSTILLAFKG